MLAELFAYPTVQRVGIACAVTQCVLWVLFAKLLPNGPWRQEPGFTAHQLVCFPIMIYLAYSGFAAWYATDAKYALSAKTRILDVEPIGHHFSQIVFAMLIFWDIPTGLLVKSLREPVMVAHHVGMCCLAVFGLLGLWTYNALFFFGVIELSGVPLAFIDIFHPAKHAPWCKWLETQPTLSKVNDLGRVLFLLAYFYVRVVLFSYVILTQVVPDTLEVIMLPVAERKGWSVPAIAFNGFFGVIFMGLQLYWGVLLVGQVQKFMLGKPKKKAS